MNLKEFLLQYYKTDCLIRIGGGDYIYDGLGGPGLNTVAIKKYSNYLIDHVNYDVDFDQFEIILKGNAYENE